ALGALAVVVGGWLLQRQTLCRSGSSRVAAVWSAERRQALAAHFGTLGGADAFARIGERLDRWAEDWSTQHREACEATRLRGEQSDQVLTVRMACLDRRLLEVEGALGVLATTSGDSLPRAQDAVLSLTPLSVCANTTALLAPVPRPEQPAMRERVEFIERELSRAQALREAGRFKEGLPLATTAALEAHALGWAPLEAEALLVRGQLLDGNGEFALAEATLRDAWTRAHAARDDRLATLIAIDVSFVLNELSRMKESDEWVWQASALAPRVGQDWELEARVATQQGHLLYTRADFTGAEVRYRRAWELRRDHQGASHPRTVAMLANVANSIGAQGRFEQAAELLVDAARQLEQALGRSHHKVGQAWNAVAEKLVALHRSAEALAAIDGILPEQEKVLGASSPFVARLHLGRAEALRELGKHEEALGEYQRSLATFEQASMPLMVGITLSAMGATSCALRRLDEGLAFTDRARALLAETFGADHEEATVALEVRGECLLEAGKPQPALEAFVTSLAARERAGDEDWTARSLVGLGRAHLALGHHADAKTLLARAVTSLEKSKLDDALLDTARGALASAR
ncbi:MAG: tetratricopeptide repeat protein, partial [Myxococcota bacterium]